MFLILTFCKIIKNDLYILKGHVNMCPHMLTFPYFKNGKKNPINFCVIKNDSFRLFFQGQLTECLLVDPTILILVPTFCKIGKNGL
jgi:hypothetical protein